jgi:hypothetical protein
MKFKLGCDPEIFMADATGKLRASCGLIGGTKARPQPLTDLGEGYCVQEDNVAIEFNIPPASGAEEFVNSIAKTMKFLNDGVGNALGFHLVNLSAASFPADQLLSPAAKEFGCDPDYNAWTRDKNPKPKANDPNLRSCGGHVHVGFDKLSIDGVQLIKMMDLFLGVASTVMDDGALRRELYGKAGAYREKEYGFEYRTLSNFWVKDDRLSRWVWDNTEKAINAVEARFAVDDYKDSILAAINDNDKEAANYLINTVNLEVLNV